MFQDRLPHRRIEPAVVTLRPVIKKLSSGHVSLSDK
jgi:hypothetical protein